MADDPMSDRLKALEGKIAAAKKAGPSEAKVDDRYSGAELAWRMVIELVAGIGIGFGMGYGIDVLLGTLPVFMVIFTGLGLAAGVKVMLGTAQSVQMKTPDEGAGDEGR